MAQNYVNIDRIEDAVEKFLASRENADSFPLSELTDSVVRSVRASQEGKVDKIVRDIELIMEGRADFFTSDDETAGKICHSRRKFFAGTKFKVVPTKMEINAGILFYGARFAPFCTQDIFPDEYVITLNGSGVQSEVLSYRGPFEQMAKIFMLLGRSNFIDCLIAESEENMKVLREADGGHCEVVISAFDMDAFYKENSFTHGDALIFEVEDWEKCRFKASVCKQSEQAGNIGKDEFLNAFEEALVSVCENEGEYLDIPEQISLAYFTAFRFGRDLRRNTSLSLDEYPSMMRDIAIKRDEAEWTLVPVDELATPGAEELPSHSHSHGHEHGHGKCSCHGHDGEADGDVVKDISPDDFSSSTGDISSLEAIVAELHLPLGQIEIYAMALDDMTNGQESFDAFYEKLIDILDPKFTDDAQQAAFMNFVEDAWEGALEYYSPSADSLKASLRTRILEMDLQRVDYSKRLLKKFEGSDVPKKIAEELRACHALMLNTLGFLNADAELADGEDYEMLELRVGDIEDRWDALTEQISDALAEV